MLAFITYACHSELVIRLDCTLHWGHQYAKIAQLHRDGSAVPTDQHHARTTYQSFPRWGSRPRSQAESVKLVPLSHFDLNCHIIIKLSLLPSRQATFDWVSLQEVEIMLPLQEWYFMNILSLANQGAVERKGFLFSKHPLYRTSR